MMSVYKYNLNYFYDFMANNQNAYTLPSNIIKIIDEVNNEIVPIVIEKTPEKNYKQTHDVKYKKQSSKDDLSWKSIRNFKTTKIEKKEGKEKLLGEIKICLNKLSSKNYETQKDKILELLKELKTEKLENETINVKSIAQTIFDIASSNQFYAELYAKLYKELIGYDTIFVEVLNVFLSTFTNNVKEIHYIDPDVDYDGYCSYNKQNDIRKSTSVFIIHLMKEQIIPVLKVMSIIVAFQDISIQYMDEPNRLNEVEEIAEMLYLILKCGISIFSNCKADYIWKFVITKNIQTFSKYKKNDKKSISNRAIFKYMDILQLIENQN